MSRDFATTIISGRLGRDPEMRVTPNGKTVTTFSVGVGRKVAGQDETTWYRCVCWEKLAETASTYLTKGSAVIIEGRIQTREYDNKEGQKVQTWELVVNELTMLGGSKSHSDTETVEDEEPVVAAAPAAKATSYPAATPSRTRAKSEAIPF